MHLIEIGATDSLSHAEELILEELKAWRDDFAIDGIALHAPSWPAQCDLLVITPHALTVVEIKGCAQKVSAPIATPLQGTWTTGNKPAHHKRGCSAA
ncbi:nuclease-related domain-containing protein [Dermacoccus abyssi]